MKENIMLCYPRSGSNWLRYIVEYNTSYSTTAEMQDTINRRPLHTSFDVIDSSNKSPDDWFFHSHWYKNYGGDKMLFVIRDYKESVVRHILAGSNTCSPEQFNLIKHSMRTMYLETLMAYHEFPGLKLLVRYEDLIDEKRIADVVDDVCLFLDVSETEKRIKFLETLPLHIENSRNFYKNVGHPIGYSDAKSTVWHRKKLSPDQLDELDQMAKDHPLFSNYLQEYIIT